MKKLFALVLLFAVSTAFAESTFPGIKVVLTPQEFQRAGLDKLTADQIGVIDAALIRHYIRTIEYVAAHPPQAADQAGEAGDSTERGWLARFGLPDFSGDSPDAPSIKARCTAWVGGNSFRLDNGQIWEGVEPINVEVLGKDVEIQPRPRGIFNLVVDGKNTTIRVHRVK